MSDSTKTLPSESASASGMVSVLIRSTARMTLQRTLDSAASQDYANVEIVVVAASGSTHPRLPQQWNGRSLRLITSDRALSRPAAANRLLGEARGEYIAFLDDDDQWKPWHLTTLVNVLRSTPMVSVAYSMAVIRDLLGREQGALGLRAHPLTFAEQSPFAIHAALIRRQLITDNAIAQFDESLELLEDLDFFIACATLTPFAFVPEVTAIWNAASGESGHGLGSNATPQAREQAIGRIRQKWMKQFEEWQLQPLGQLDLAALYLRCGDRARAERMLKIASRNEWRDQTLLNRFLQLCHDAGLIVGNEDEVSSGEVVQINIAASTKARAGQNPYRMSAVGMVTNSPAR